MKKGIIIGIAAALLLAGGAIFITAQKADRGGKRGFGGHGGPFMGKMAQELGLTDEQKAQAKTIFEASRSNIEPIMTELRENRKASKTLGTDGNFDAGKVEAHAASQAALMAKMIVEKERAKAQMFSILNDEQKAKAAELHEKMGEKFGRGKGRHGFGGKEQGSMF